MPEIKSALRIATLFVIFIVQCQSIAIAQVERKVDGQFLGETQTYNYQLVDDKYRKRVWNVSNKLFKSPMQYPKGNLVVPSYVLIPKDRNVEGDPFARRFPPRALADANEDAFLLMKKISGRVLNDVSDTVRIVVFYYLDLNGTIAEVEFVIRGAEKIPGKDIEELESAIKSELRFVTESSDFKSGNYIRFMQSWPR